MTSLTDTQVVTASGGLVELGYAERASTYTIPSTSSSYSTVMFGPVTFVSDGSPLIVEFQSPASSVASPGSIYVNLVVDGSVTGIIYQSIDGSGTQNVGIRASRRLTLSAGTHTIGVSAYGSGSPSPSIQAGNGGVGSFHPMFLRVSKIVEATQWPAVTTGTIICTSSTRPASPFEGQKIYETDTNRELTYDSSAWVQTVELGAWTSWTPTVTQGSTTFTLNTNDCAYTRFGRTITAQFRVSIGSGTGQTGQGIVMTLPVTPKSSGGPVYGPVWVYDASGGVPYDGSAFRYGAGVGFIGDWSGNQLLGAVPTLIFTTGDEIRGTVTYEAA